ncbi:hypothetical protein C8F01DRAFT_1083213 [Mycena amicta]|nr:hypothetical protein C8F01DRAFT_1083213 [Mycena amicta]
MQRAYTASALQNVRGPKEAVVLEPGCEMCVRARAASLVWDEPRRRPYAGPRRWMWGRGELDTVKRIFADNGGWRSVQALSRRDYAVWENGIRWQSGRSVWLRLGEEEGGSAKNGPVSDNSVSESGSERIRTRTARNESFGQNARGFGQVGGTVLTNAIVQLARHGTRTVASAVGSSEERGSGTVHSSAGVAVCNDSGPVANGIPPSLKLAQRRLEALSKLRQYLEMSALGHFKTLVRNKHRRSYSVLLFQRASKREHKLQLVSDAQRACAWRNVTSIPAVDPPATLNLEVASLFFLSFADLKLEQELVSY